MLFAYYIVHPQLSLLIHPDKLQRTFEHATKAFQALVRSFERCSQGDVQSDAMMDEERGGGGGGGGGKRSGAAAKTKTISRSNEVPTVLLHRMCGDVCI